MNERANQQNEWIYIMKWHANTKTKEKSALKSPHNVGGAGGRAKKNHFVQVWWETGTEN